MLQHSFTHSTVLMHLKQQLQQQQQRLAVSQVPVKPQHAAKKHDKMDAPS